MSIIKILSDCVSDSVSLSEKINNTIEQILNFFGDIYLADDIKFNNYIIKKIYISDKYSTPTIDCIDCDSKKISSIEISILSLDDLLKLVYLLSDMFDKKHFSKRTVITKID